MHRRAPARMAGVPCLQEIERFAAPHLADDDAVGTQTHGRLNKYLQIDAGRGPQADDVIRREEKLARILENDDALAALGRLGEKRIRQCGLAGRCAAGDQDVLTASNGGLNDERVAARQRTRLDPV